MIKDNNVNSFNILLIGATGVWSDVNHIPNLLKLQTKRTNVRVGAVCDINNPYSNDTKDNLKELLKRNKSLWIPASNEFDAPIKALESYHKDSPIHLMVISCNPTAHFSYASWAISRGIHVVCDKPLLAQQNVATDVVSAIDMSGKYDLLKKQYIAARQKYPNLIFSLVLRRRALLPFRLVAERLKLVQDKYGASVNHINILSHSGIYKYPGELLGSGAHDFGSGMGALSHSSYHYIDLLSWYLRSAPGEVKYLIPRLTSITRVRDYLASGGYKALQTLNNHKLDFVSLPKIPERVLGVELDFSFNIQLVDSNHRILGDANFVSNHLSFSPRTRPYMVGESNPAQYSDGGRVSHLYIDLHQSGLQNIQIFKNDLALGNSNVRLEFRSHPLIDEVDESESLYFEDAYRKAEFTLGNLLELTVVSAMTNKKLNNDMTPNLLDDELNIKLFSKFYELIARDFTEPTPPVQSDFITL